LLNCDYCKKSFGVKQDLKYHTNRFHLKIESVALREPVAIKSLVF
jgi:hypothetical protein